MISEIVDPPAAFDADAVSSLTGDPGDRAFAVVFVTRFRGLLPERVRRIGAALATDDVDEAMDAVLSLKASSATVGALELADLASDLQQHLRRGDVAQAMLVESLLADAVERADRALGRYLSA